MLGVGGTDTLVLPRLRVGLLPFSFIYTQQRAAISLPSLAERLGTLNRRDLHDLGSWRPQESCGPRAAVALVPSRDGLGSGLALGTLFTQIKEVYERYYLSSYHFPPDYLSLKGHTLLHMGS